MPYRLALLKHLIGSLECIAIGVVYVEERKAQRTLGEFVDAHFVASIARDTGPNPFLINERGNFVVLTVIVGTARYTSSNERALAIVFPIVLLLGILGVLFVLWPILIFRWFARRELVKRDKKQAGAVSSTGNGDDIEIGRDAPAAKPIAPPAPERPQATGPASAATDPSTVQPAASQPLVDNPSRIGSAMSSAPPSTAANEVEPP